jgi:hypothetical protein
MENRLMDSILRYQFDMNREIDSVPWRMFHCLVEAGDGIFRWPDKRWLPLGFSLRGRKR